MESRDDGLVNQICRYVFRLECDLWSLIGRFANSADHDPRRDGDHFVRDTGLGRQNRRAFYRHDDGLHLAGRVNRDFGDKGRDLESRNGHALSCFGSKNCGC